MTAFFSLATQDQSAAAARAMEDTVDLTQDRPPGFFQGMGDALGNGLMRGAARTAQTLELAGSVPVIAADAAFGQEGRLTDAYFRGMDSRSTAAVDYWTPNANDVGTAGRVLGGLSEIAAPLMLGAGNPSLLIGNAEMGTAVDLARAGVDADMAVSVGIKQGAGTAFGFALPFLGKTLATRMASGAAGNLVVNTGTAATSAAQLKQAGAPDQAAQFNPADTTSRVVDVLSGLVFGAIYHAGAPKGMQPSDVDAVLAARNAKNFQQDTAPGVPADMAASAAHQQAMQTSISQMLRGDAVSVDLGDSGFVPTGEQAARLNDLQKAADAEARTTSEAPATTSEAGAVTSEAPATVKESSTVQADPLADLPELRAAMQAIADRPDLSIEIDGQQISGTDALAHFQEISKNADLDGQAIAAAAECWLRSAA